MVNQGDPPTTPTAQAEAAQARSEIQQYLDMSRQRRRMFPRAAAVGLAAGIVAVLFRMALVAGDDLRNGLIAWSYQWPAWGWIFPVLLGAAGAVIAAALVRTYAPEASGSGIPHIKAVLQRFRTLRWQRVLGVKFVGGCAGDRRRPGTWPRRPNYPDERRNRRRGVWLAGRITT